MLVSYYSLIDGSKIILISYDKMFWFHKQITVFYDNPFAQGTFNLLFIISGFT